MFYLIKCRCDFLSLQLPTMTFNSIEIKRENSIKFLGVIIDENLTWKNHIEVVENKISKNIGVFYREFFLVICLISKTFQKSTSPSFTFTSVTPILLDLVFLKLNSRKS